VIRSALLIVLVVLIIAPRGAAADVGVGLSFQLGGFSAEAGPVECAACGYGVGSTGVALRTTWGYRPRLRLGLDARSSVQVVEAAGPRVLLQGAGVVTGHYRAGGRWWLGGGVGVATLHIFGAPGQTLGPALLLEASVRYEPTRWGHLVPQVSAEATRVVHPSPWAPTSQFMLGVGVSWHTTAD